MMRLDNFINDSQEKPEKRPERKEIPENTIKDKFLIDLMKKLRKLNHAFIKFEKQGEQYYFQSMDSARIAMVSGYVSAKNMNVLEKFELDVDKVIFDEVQNVAKIVEYEQQEEDFRIFGEPEIELTTEIIAKTTSLIDFLKRINKQKYQYYYYSPKLMFKPEGRIVRIIVFDDEFKQDYIIPEIRVLKGQDVGLYRIDVISKYLTLFQPFYAITIQYTAKKPMLITSRNQYPLIRAWLAPWVEE